MSGCHFRCVVTCSKVLWFQKHFGHDRNSDFRKRALEEGSQAVPEPLRELSGRVPPDAAGHGTLCPSSCGTVSRGPATSDSSGALERWSFRMFWGHCLKSQIFKNTAGTKLILALENLPWRRDRKLHFEPLRELPGRIPGMPRPTKPCALTPAPVAQCAEGFRLLSNSSRTCKRGSVGQFRDIV